MKEAVENKSVTSLSSALSEQSTESIEDCYWLTSEVSLHENSMEEIMAKQKNVIFYVAGYTGRSISRSNRCEDCQRILCSAGTDEEDGWNCELDSFISLANRGGLSYPSGVNFLTYRISFSIYSQISSNEELLKSILDDEVKMHSFIPLLISWRKITSLPICYT